MAIERTWDSIGPIAFAANGGSDGTITVSSVSGFRVKQTVSISGIALPTLKLEIKRVLSPTKLIVGPVVTTGKLLARQDLSLYTLAALSTIKIDEQPKVRLPPPDIIQAVYEQEPVLALRTIGVDEFGRPWTGTNPVPVSGTFVFSGNDPTEQRTQNVSLALADTEYEITLPDNVKRYQIRVRDDASKGRISFVSGQTSTNYWTLTRGTVIDSYVMNLPVNPKVYMRLDKPTQVVEIMTWTKP
jgi:hypothetical protein